MQTGGEVLADILVRQGVETVFGVPGESYLALLDALYDRKDRIRTVMARHEGGAAFMAAAHGKLTGRPGVCMVTRGPGATNAAIGVHTATQDSSPMILIVGQVSRGTRDRESFQEIDYRNFFGDVAKWTIEINDPDRIPELVGRAFHCAVSGRPGPVVLAFPEDVLQASTSATIPSLPLAPVLSEPGDEILSRVCRVLETAERPLILVAGNNWSDQGRRALREFAESNIVPVIVGFRCQDLIDNFSHAYAGDAGFGMSPHVGQLIERADVVLAVGTRFDEITTRGFTLFSRPDAGQKIVHVHASDRELGKIVAPTLAIQALPDTFFSGLGRRRFDHRMKWKEWFEEASSGHGNALESHPSPGDVDLTAVVKWLAETLSEDVILTNGAGNFAIWPARYFPLRDRGRLLAPQCGAMGYGLPAAITAKLSYPERDVVCFAGDGDFLMTGQELGTAVQHELSPIVVLCNNGMYGTIRMHQERQYPGRVQGTGIQSPDFVALGKAYGAFAERVQKTDEFPAAFRRAQQSGRAALLELIIDPEAIAPGETLSAIRARNSVSPST